MQIQRKKAGGLRIALFATTWQLLRAIAETLVRRVGIARARYVWGVNKLSGIEVEGLADAKRHKRGMAGQLTYAPLFTKVNSIYLRVHTCLRWNSAFSSEMGERPRA